LFVTRVNALQRVNALAAIGANIRSCREALAHLPMSVLAGTEVVDPVILPPLCTRGVIL
jgi:hypothetical protein